MGLSCEEAFCTRDRTWQPVTERVPAEGDRAALAARLGRRGRVPHAQSRARRAGRGRQDLRASRCCRTRRASCTWGTSSTTRSATSSRTCAAAAAAACCGRWATTRSACRPRTPRSARAGIRARSPSATSPRSASRCGAWAGRSTGRARSRPTSPSTTAGRSGCSCSFYERGLAYRKAAPVKLVPDRPDGARERAGDRRPLRALRRRGRGQEPDAVVLQDHRLRRRAARRDGTARALAGARPDDAAQLDRPLRGCARSIFRVDGSARTMPVFTTRPDTLFGATFFVLAPEHPARRAADSAPDGECARVRIRACRGAHGRSSARRREKDGVFTGRYAVNPVNGEAIPIWVADYVLMELRHGRDHGRAGARRARLRLRRQVRAADPARSSRPADGEAREGRRVRPHTPRTRCWSTPASSTGLPAPEAKQAIVDVARGARPRGGDDRLPPARLAALAAALLGLPDPDRSTASGCGDRSRARTTSCRCCCPRSTSSCRRAARRWRRPRTGSNVDVPALRRPGDARDGHDGHVRRLVLVLHPLHRSAGTTTEPFARDDRRLLAARQPVHRRHRARDPAPDVRALLHEGDARDGPASASASRSRASSTRG